MSRIDDFIMEVEYLYDNGHSEKEISSLTGMSIKSVRDAILYIEEERFNAGADNDMEALVDYEDDSYALASAGYGTDEDYGYYGE
jgi:transcription initiation factor IIE alpha subunit